MEGLLGLGLCTAWCCVLAFAAGRSPSSLAPRLARAGGAVGIGVGVFLGLSFGAQDLDAGRKLFDGSLAADHFASAVDALVLLLAGLLSIAVGAQEGESSLTKQLGLWLGAAATCVAAHATGLVALVGGLEVAALAAWATRGRHTAERPPWLFTACSLLGLALLFGATAQLDMVGLPGRTAKVFNQWNGSMRYHYTLMEALDKGQSLPSGLAAQARGKVISGMALASLLLPGIAFLSVGVFGRFLAPGGIASPGRAFVRLAALVALVRVFVSALHAPRMVNEPYGWVGPLAAVGVGLCIVGAFALRRAERLRELDAGLARLHSGIILVGLVIAANFYGHREIVGGPMSPTLELSWSQRAGDDALAATLGLAFLAFLASASLQVWVAQENLDERGSLQGLFRLRRGSALTLVGLLFALSCFPGSALFAALIGVLRSLVEHTSLRIFVPLLVLCAMLGGWHVLAWVRDILWSEPSSSESPRRSRAAWLALVACLLAAVGVNPDNYIFASRLASASLSKAVGSSERGQWIKESRLRWRGEATLVDADAKSEAAQDGK